MFAYYRNWFTYKKTLSKKLKTQVNTGWTKNVSYITLTVEHNYISSSSTVGIQLHVSTLYVGHLQVVI